MTGALVLLVLLLGGGGYGFWRYNQSQYYVGVDQNGYVSIFRGTNQSLAGISLSSLVQRSTLKVSELARSDQAAITQTISQGSVNDAQQLIDQLQSQVNDCKQQWQALAAWQAKNVSYQSELPRTPPGARARPRSRRRSQPGPAAERCRRGRTAPRPRRSASRPSALPTPGDTAPPRRARRRPAAARRPARTAKASPTATSATTRAAG